MSDEPCKTFSTSTAIIVAIVVVFLLIGGYVGGYFMFGEVHVRPYNPKPEVLRVFRWRWEARLFKPMARLEQVVTHDWVETIALADLYPE